MCVCVCVCVERGGGGGRGGVPTFSYIFVQTLFEGIEGDAGRTRAIFSGLKGV